jgi:MoxR-like ATPase
VGTTSLGEALKDRFVWLRLEYQSEEEETEIIIQKLDDFLKNKSTGETLNLDLDNIDKIGIISAKISRITRSHPNLRRGASIRAGIDLASLMLINHLNSPQQIELDTFWYDAAEMALSTKIELEESSEVTLQNIIHDCVRAVLKDFQ